jgi:endonuclease YncB( thermonuclease family)
MNRGNWPAGSRRPRRRFLDALLALAILGVIAFLAARLEHFSEEAPEGTAIVNDGDTLTVSGERIRLVGIDAPELDQNCQRDGGAYPCGRLSRSALAERIGGRAVTCRGAERDKYDRLLAECSAGGVDLNAAQVRAGWAVAYGGYEREEGEARAARAGIWAGSFERPRAWRDARGHAAEDPHDMRRPALGGLRALFGIQ